MTPAAFAALVREQRRGDVGRQVRDLAPGDLNVWLASLVAAVDIVADSVGRRADLTPPDLDDVPEPAVALAALVAIAVTWAESMGDVEQGAA